MKSTATLFCFITSLLTTITLYAQDPNIIWQKTIGGSDSEFFYDLKETNDGGYILGGYSVSDISGNKTDPSNGEADIWAVKINENGEIEWQNSIGGNNTEDAHSITITDDGGYILVGESDSNISGDKTEDERGLYDYWVVKIDGSGNVEWDKTIGGTDRDWLPKIAASTQGDYFICGESGSDISGEKTENLIGGTDYWVLKIDDSGTILWQDTIGGTDYEGFRAIASTFDGGVIIGGSSESNTSGDKTEDSKGGRDYWIVKLDVSGAIEWEKTIGGNSGDRLSSITQTEEGGYLLGGTSYSDISGDKTESAIGDGDYWIVKTDANGSIEWQNTIGGENYDNVTTVFQTTDGDYLIGGYSSSDISADKDENSLGGLDYWVLRLNNTGFIEWQNTIGGNSSDYLQTFIQSSDGNYVLGGDSGSNISGDKTEDSFGQKDYWVIKLNNILGLSENELSNNLTVYPNPTNNTLQLNATNQQIDRVKIFSVKGDLVQQIEGFETSKTIDVSPLASGMYYVQFTAGRQIATKKFIKQ